MISRTNLTGLRRAVLGTAGSIRLSGGGVMPKHAEIAVLQSNGEVITAVRPLDGGLAVERGGRYWHVAGSWPLADGDVILVGPHRLTYRDLGSPLQELKTTGQQEAVSWLI